MKLVVIHDKIQLLRSQSYDHKEVPTNYVISRDDVVVRISYEKALDSIEASLRSRL